MAVPGVIRQAALRPCDRNVSLCRRAGAQQHPDRDLAGCTAQDRTVPGRMRSRPDRPATRAQVHNASTDPQPFEP
jgi:hypothetical protein